MPQRLRSGAKARGHIQGGKSYKTGILQHPYVKALVISEHTSVHSYASIANASFATASIQDYLRISELLIIFVS